MSRKNQDNINFSFVKIEKSQNKNCKIRNDILKKIRNIKQKQNKNWTFENHKLLLNLQKQINIG